MASLLQQGLQEENQVVSLAFDGQSGLEIAKSYEFDVIVLDWMLPLMDGPEVARRLRKLGNSSPILMLTARDAVPDIVKGLDARRDFSPSPFLLLNSWPDSAHSPVARRLKPVQSR
jgi:DNA-binding response OmpR family regulator